MLKTASCTDGSLYTVSDHITGSARYYGRFDAQRILGRMCAIVVEPIADGDPRAVDALGEAGTFTRRGAAIHVSGLDPFGHRTGPGFIRAVALYAVDWMGHERYGAGLGHDRPEPAAIVTWDGNAAGRGHRSDAWQHHAHYASCSSYVTAAGVLAWSRRLLSGCTFEARGVAEAAARTRSSPHLTGQQHVSAIRRLLETLVDVQNNTLPAVLRRCGRWSYAWTDKG